MRRPSGIAKLNAPRLFGVVPRHRLFALLDDNRGRPLIWLDSPPGAGKTSLAASYLEARKLPHLWYQIDPGDEDPATVFQYLTWAVQALPGAELLGRLEAIMQQGGKVSLNRSLCWVDAWRFEARAAKAAGVPSSVRTPTSAGVPVDAAASTMAGLDLYTGAFLPEDESEAWSVATRERLRGKFIHLLAAQGAALETQGDLDTAIGLYFRGIDADPVVEVFHQGLMRCYQRQGRHTEAISAFRRLRQTLSAVLGVAPSEASRRLFEDSMRECAGTHDIHNVLPMARPHR